MLLTFSKRLVPFLAQFCIFIEHVSKKMVEKVERRCVNLKASKPCKTAKEPPLGQPALIARLRNQ